MSITDAVPGVDAVVDASHRYFVDSIEADQGAATSTGDKTIKDHVDAIGATKKATLYFLHDVDADTTTYTVTTSETIPSNITCVVENGAIFAGAGTLTVAGYVQIGIGQVYNAAGVIVFSGSGAAAHNVLVASDGSPNPALSISGTGNISTNGTNITINDLGSGNRYSYIDLVGDETYTDYGLRVLRGNAGANTSSNIHHKGTGAFNLITEEAAPISFSTSNTVRVTIASDGVTTFSDAIKLLEKSADPSEPAEGECVIWMSDGTGKGDDGDIMIASQAGGTTNYGTLFDHSGGAGW